MSDELPPATIPRHTLDVLEFGKLLPELVERAGSAWGKELAAGVRPLLELDEARASARSLREWLALESGDPTPPSLAMPDVRSPLARAATPGALLDGEALLAIARVATTSRLAGEVLAQRADDAPGLAADADRELGRFPELERAVARAIDRDGRVRDDASPTLERLRRRIESTRAAILDRLEQLASRIGTDAFATQRGGRYTVAVPIEWLGRVRGVVHDRSASGATVFLEPFEVIELGNRVREDEEAERDEVRRILIGLTNQVGEEAQRLEAAARELARLDLFRAKARLFRDWECVLPELELGGPIRLVDARHPLLARARAAQGGDPVVPLSLDLGEEARILVITGPNMGGKTVSLKTLGLLTLMGMAGLGVPAAEGTRLGFFPSVIADIGDEQSIEENLSTFASHIRHVSDGLAHASARSLVLLDELGAGTDPAEGAALGQAVLEALADSGALAVVTTHHGALKGMAMSHPAIMNASMAFNPETHVPLYELVPGVPGRSLGIEVAERLRLDAQVLARARELVPGTERRLGELLQDLERRRLALAAAEEELQGSRRSLSALMNKYRERLAGVRAERARVLEDARQRAESKLSEAEELVHSARRALRMAGSPAGTSAARAAASSPGRELESLAGRLKELEARNRPSAGPSPSSLAPVAASEVSPGGRYWVPDLSSMVEVIEPPDSAGRVMVRRGRLRLELGVERLRVASEESRAAAGEADAGRLPPAPQIQVEAPPGIEIDLRGMTGDEGVAAVERYLEQATVHGLSRVRIIHGKGTGALRTRIQEFLRSHPRVSAFRLGEVPEGGSGVTVADIA